MDEVLTNHPSDEDLSPSRPGAPNFSCC